MNDSVTKLKLLLNQVALQCDAEWIGFSGGLDSSILAQIKKDQNLNAITIIAKDFIGSDLTYSQIIAKHTGIPLELRYVGISEMLNAVDNTIKILKNFNDIEIRNSIIPYLYLKALQEKNVKKVITGDGADEIFAGYNFLIEKTDDEISNELKRLKGIMHFTSEQIANELGISVQMPFIDKNIIEMVETLPIDLLVNRKNNTRFGKWVLRKAFENDLPPNVIWREKTPMQDGAGTASLTKLFDSIITDEIFEKKSKKIKSEDDVRIRTKESLHYYKLYKEKFGVPKQHDGLTCPDCHTLVISNPKFCKMCGKFPLT